MEQTTPANSSKFSKASPENGTNTPLINSPGSKHLTQSKNRS
jgi:hypothetical protein